MVRRHDCDSWGPLQHPQAFNLDAVERVKVLFCFWHLCAVEDASASTVQLRNKVETPRGAQAYDLPTCITYTLINTKHHMTDSNVKTWLKRETQIADR